jgi:type I restriction enzyme M protein
LDNVGKSYLMVECKTWGEEHDKEKTNLLRDGGQLFSYFIQEKETQYLCLYSSILDRNNILFKNDIIVVSEKIRNTTNQQEALEAWNPQVFEKGGLFEESNKPYSIKFSGVTKSDLRPMTERDGGNIFNRFAEILRKNVVSDKTNAFNKIFNLFLCKIVDEDKRGQDEEMKFQWRQHEQNEDVLLRLNDLYKEGMKEYLNLEISSVTEEEFEVGLKNVNSEQGKDMLRKIFIQQKLYSGNEFAFKEVFDKDSFEENCIVVKEVVKLLEEYRIKYQSKQQFLGDFFERLLNTGIKQESGQFFTPIPLTSFICKSLPLEHIIEEKNNRGEIDFLPYVIDFASGSGHFLTEIMDEIDAYVGQISNKPNWIKGGREAEKKFNAHKNDYYWAKEYVYGIEKDYRLAKTAKISTFLNGDGDANVICTDGLDDFELSKDYKGKLSTYASNSRGNYQFDIVVSNPPYSVSGFKATLPNGKKSFELFNSLSDKSKEIECLFIERTEQLLREGGVAGIILPITIFTGDGVYMAAREILLKRFSIKAILEVGGNAFMEAGIKTAVVFLQKNKASYLSEAESVVNGFFSRNRDFSWDGVEKVMEKYVESCFGTDVSIGEYISFIKGEGVEKIDDTEAGSAYSNKPPKFILEKEREKLLFFLLSISQRIILANSGEKQTEKDFLGYEFRKRKGQEGIIIYENNSLYNPTTLNDRTKLNNYILDNFLGKLGDNVPEELKNNVSIKKLSSLIDFSSAEFNFSLSTKKIDDLELSSEYPLKTIKNIKTILESGSRPKGGVARIKEGIPSIGGEHIGLDGTVVFSGKEKYVPVNFYDNANQGHIMIGDILICKDGAQTGKTAYVDESFQYKDALVNEHVFILRLKNEEILQKYTFNFLLSDIGQKLLRSKTTGSAQGGLNKPSLLSIPIPVPSLDVQKKIIKELDEVEKDRNNIKSTILLSRKQKILYNYLKPEITKKD